MQKVLYTAEATVTGGRAGHVRSSDGRLELDLAIPAELGGQSTTGTNPEQLFAAGYAACFQSAVLNVAQGRKIDLTDAKITARVGLGPTGHGGFGLTVSLDLIAPQISRSEAAVVMERAHKMCPYSNATRGNVDVALLFDGTPLEPSGEAD